MSSGCNACPTNPSNTEKLATSHQPRALGSLVSRAYTAQAAAKARSKEVQRDRRDLAKQQAILVAMHQRDEDDFKEAEAASKKAADEKGAVGTKDGKPKDRERRESVTK